MPSTTPSNACSIPIIGTVMYIPNGNDGENPISKPQAIPAIVIPIHHLEMSR